jgi:hypothetical protein
MRDFVGVCLLLWGVLRLALNLRSFYLSLPSAGITELCYYIWVASVLFLCGGCSSKSF